MPSSLLASLHSLVAKSLAENWTLFRDINGLARRNGAVDAIMIFSANDLIWLLPLLAALVWLSVARWSPYHRWLRERYGVRLGEAARRATQRAALSAALAVGIALLLNTALGALIFEPRPFIANSRAVRLLIPHTADASFPSDHEAVAMAIALALGVSVVWALAMTLRVPLVGRAANWSWGGALRLTLWPLIVALVALFAAALIGFSRVYDGVHYPLDIVGGAVSGALGVMIAFALLPLAERLYRPLIHGAEALRLA